MTEDERAEAIHRAAERTVKALHAALKAEGVTTTGHHIYATAMVLAVTLTAAATTPDEDEETIERFREGLAIFRGDQRDVRGMTMQ